MNTAGERFRLCRGFSNLYCIQYNMDVMVFAICGYGFIVMKNESSFEIPRVFSLIDECCTVGCTLLYPELLYEVSSAVPFCIIQGGFLLC
jgi:hypothetical protein